jgi:hypothetical protein
MRRLSMESRTGRSKGWPFKVVVAIMGFRFSLNCGRWCLLCGVVAVKVRLANCGKNFCSVEVERPKWQRACIHLIEVN